ncbi:hypothetical protein [Halomontanus rarus]|uniref:hypothetical protein n=1 Tax=Halomontanus rarus TaxID=3034020 RepID=UPI0023E7870B|nr:hypothetical protein [Halovivax sp. TS33]
MTGYDDLLTAVIAGLLGSLVCGSILHALGELVVLGQLVGSRGTLEAWLFLLVGGVLGAVGYSRGVRQVAPLGFFASDPRTGAALGLAFGILGWLLAIVVIPRWVLLLGFTPPIVPVHWPSLVGLLVYGAIVGGLVPILRTRFD